MDNPLTPLVHLPRRTIALPKLFLFFENPRKSQWFSNPYQSYNYSFILEGSGRYRTAEGTKEIVAPSLFLQNPELQSAYGPDEIWWEFSLTYLTAEKSALERCGCWPLPAVIQAPPEQVDMWRTKIAILRDTAARLVPVGQYADVLDAMAVALILDFVSMGQQFPLRGESDALGEIQKELQAIDRPLPNLDELARSHGFSPSTFRRHWKARFDVSPAVYNLNHRLAEACRLLQTTLLPIARVAEVTGFEDPYHFSRLFRSKIGMSPLHYRKQRMDD